MNVLQGLQLRDAMTITGNTAEPEQKRAGVTGHRKSRPLCTLSKSLSLDSEHWKPDTLVKPETGIKTQQPELWSNPYQAREG